MFKMCHYFQADKYMQNFKSPTAAMNVNYRFCMCNEALLYGKLSTGEKRWTVTFTTDREVILKLL